MNDLTPIFVLLHQANQPISIEQRRGLTLLLAEALIIIAVDAEGRTSVI